MGYVVVVAAGALSLWGVWTGVNAIRGREETRFSRPVTAALGAVYVVVALGLFTVALSALL